MTVSNCQIPNTKQIDSCKIGCQGEVQLGGPGPWYNQGGPAKVWVRKSFIYAKSFLVL